MVRLVLLTCVGWLGFSSLAMAGSQITSWPTIFEFLLLFVVVFSVAGGLYFLRFCVRMVHAHFQHRRAVRIDATLHAGEKSFDGYISIIGLNGCRFHPQNKTTEAAFLRTLASPDFNDFDVVIAGVKHPVFVDGFHAFFSALYFYEILSRLELDRLLSLSSTEPYLVPHIGHVSTRKKWREQIAERRKKIEALKSEHLH